MKIVETKAYKVELTTEERLKIREVIEFLETVENEIFPHQVEVETESGEIVTCNHYDIDMAIALLTGLKNGDYEICQ